MPPLGNAKRGHICYGVVPNYVNLPCTMKCTPDNFEKSIISIGEYDFTNTVDELMDRLFEDKKFQNCLVRNADFASSSFTRCKMEKVVFIGCEFPGVSFNNCILDDVTFINCEDLPGFYDCDTKSVSFQRVRNS